MKDTLEKIFDKKSGQQTLIGKEMFVALGLAVIKQTSDWAVRNGFNVTFSSEKTKKLSKILSSAFDYMPKEEVNVLTEALSVIIEEQIPLTSGPVGTRYGVVFKLCGNKNDHNYPLDLPILTVDTGGGYFRGVTARGFLGNNLPKDKGSIELVSDEDIASILGDLLVTGAFHLEEMCRKFSINRDYLDLE